MSYADGQYPTCDHEAHITRQEIERWWARVGGRPPAAADRDQSSSVSSAPARGLVARSAVQLPERVQEEVQHEKAV